MKWWILTVLFPGALWAAPELRLDLPGGATMDFVWIEAGEFVMGTSSDYGAPSEYERPQHEVIISRGFWIGKHEITQKQWQSVMGTTPWLGTRFVREDPQHPAVCISWLDLQEMIHRLNTHVGQEAYRLPTEAEWEYACRASTATLWSFGDDEEKLGAHAWYRDSVDLFYAHRVGAKLPNPWGLFDMHGNVWEWVQDWYDREYYHTSPRVDPEGPSVHSPEQRGDNPVIRGGSFYHGASDCRSARRAYGFPYTRSASIGARLLRDAMSPTASSARTWGQAKARMLGGQEEGANEDSAADHR